MRVITWNVNGVRSVLCKEKDGKKHTSKIPNNVLAALIQENNPDVVCLQEVKCGPDVDIAHALKLKDLGYKYCGINCATVRKGYSGTCTISKAPPLAVTFGFGYFNTDPLLNNEGRIITTEYEGVYVVNVYTPNSKSDLSRLDFRVKTWDLVFREYCATLQNKKPIIVCGDLNVAPEDIDVNNPKSAKGSHGFTTDERVSFKELLKQASLVDAFRLLHKDRIAFTWFSPFARSREKNKGWRIDHILVSSRLSSKVGSTEVLGSFYGSDHVPFTVDIIF